MTSFEFSVTALSTAAEGVGDKIQATDNETSEYYDFEPKNNNCSIPKQIIDQESMQIKSYTFFQHQFSVRKLQGYIFYIVCYNFTNCSMRK